MEDASPKTVSTKTMSKKSCHVLQTVLNVTLELNAGLVQKITNFQEDDA